MSNCPLAPATALTCRLSTEPMPLRPAKATRRASAVRVVASRTSVLPALPSSDRRSRALPAGRFKRCVSLLVLACRVMLRAASGAGTVLVMRP